MKSERTPLDKQTKETFEEQIKRIADIIDKREREGKFKTPAETEPFYPNRSTPRPRNQKADEVDENAEERANDHRRF